MAIAESLKKIRKQYKMTQDDIAKLLGVSRSGYAYYETGKTLPSVEVLNKLAAIYDTTLDAVVGNPPKKTPGRFFGETVLVGEDHNDPLIYMKKDEQTLIMAFRLLSDEDKEKLSSAAIEMLRAQQTKDE